eukprot:5271703-Pyramimonas_sp.AAC.1
MHLSSPRYETPIATNVIGAQCELLRSRTHVRQRSASRPPPKRSAKTSVGGDLASGSPLARYKGTDAEICWNS